MKVDMGKDPYLKYQIHQYNLDGNKGSAKSLRQGQEVSIGNSYIYSD
jgi:hypothetical protein